MMPSEEEVQQASDSNNEDYDNEYDSQEEKNSPDGEGDKEKAEQKSPLVENEEEAEPNSHQPEKQIITENQKRKNLLLREVFRFFERAVRVHFAKQVSEKDPDQVTKFIEKCFGLNIPIYLLVLMAEDKTMLQNLVSLEEIFLVGLPKQISELSSDEQRESTEKRQDFIKKLLLFLDPNDPSTSIKPHLQILFDKSLIRDGEAQMLKVQPLPNFLIKQEESKEKQNLMNKQQDHAPISFPILPFLDQVFKCLTSEETDKQSEVVHLFKDDPFL